MVENFYLKCQVCGIITRIRLQHGRVRRHPVVITCGKCKVSLSGFVELYPKVKHEFDNAKEIEHPELTAADYLAECSGEFPVFKQTSDSSENIGNITPFMRLVSRIGDNDKIEEYFDAVNELSKTQESWSDIKKVFDLSLTDSEYLVPEIKKVFSGKYFECRNKIEVLRAVHMFEVHYFYTPLFPMLTENKKRADDFLNLDPIQMNAMIDVLNNNAGYKLNDLQKAIYKLYGEFIEVYEAFIPAISVQHIGKENFDFEKEGTSTSSFDTVKQFYLDVYETLGNLLIIPLMLDNIKYRNSPIYFDEEKKITFEDFLKMPKGKRFSICKENEYFTAFIDLKSRTKIRNSIGHNDVEYDAVTQVVTYTPNPADRTKQKNIYLLEYEMEALDMFNSVLAISEYIYKIKQVKLIHEDDTFIRELGKKIDPYALCPCCSGKKYKFCHGKKN